MYFHLRQLGYLTDAEFFLGGRDLRPSLVNSLWLNLEEFSFSILRVLLLCSSN